MIHFHFSESSINYADWLQALFSFLLVVISSIALSEWKKKKKYDIYIEAISNLRLFITTATDYFFRISNELSARLGSDDIKDIASNMNKRQEILYENQTYIYFLKSYPSIKELGNSKKYKDLKNDVFIIMHGFEELNSLISELDPFTLFIAEEEGEKILNKLLYKSTKHYQKIKTEIKSIDNNH